MPSIDSTVPDQDYTWSEEELAFFQRHAHQTDALLMYQDPVFRPLPHHIQQVIARQRMATKVPAWMHYPLYYPPTVHLEQASSEACARYRATLVRGKKGLDATLNLGIDT